MKTPRTLDTPDGETLALYDWPVEGGPARASVVLVHGLGEHAQRHVRLAGRLNGWGFAVLAADHHGHGASSGARGGLPASNRLVDDLALVVDAMRATTPDLPLVLLGHSLGGLVAASFVARNVRRVDALVLSSPALDAGLSPFQRFLIATLSRLAPDLRVGNGLDIQSLSHDPAMAAAYRQDPKCHDRIGARLARFLADEGTFVQSVASEWKVPTLLMYAGDDRLVNPNGSRAFEAAAPVSFVSTRCFPAHYHEIFNEPDPASVFDTLQHWLEERFPLA